MDTNMIKLLTLLLLIGCGTDEEEVKETRTEVVVEKADPVEVVVTGTEGEKGDVGSSGSDGEDGEACYTQNEFVKTKTHGDHEDYYYDVLMVCPDSVNPIARSVKYHEEVVGE